MSTQTLENDNSSTNDTVTLETTDSSSITEITETVTEPKSTPEPKTPKAKNENPVTLYAKGVYEPGSKTVLKVDKKSTIKLARGTILILEQDGKKYTYTKSRIS